MHWGVWCTYSMNWMLSDQLLLLLLLGLLLLLLLLLLHHLIGPHVGVHALWSHVTLSQALHHWRLLHGLMGKPVTDGES